jgi:hypothetical protein
MPEQLIELPHFPGDELEPQRTGGDLCIQACSDDPQVAAHAVHNLTRLAIGTAVVRWHQQGFGRTSSITPSSHWLTRSKSAQASPRPVPPPRLLSQSLIRRSPLLSPPGSMRQKT